LVEAVACGGTVKVELGAAGAAARADGGTGNAGSVASGEGGGPSAHGSAGRASIGDAGDAGMFGAAGEPSVSACEVDGVVHPVGKPFACDCNTCWCEFDGTISSTLIDCPVCTYMGETHTSGEKFPSRDGCNTCECSPGGVLSCTEKACSCNPDKEWYRHYAATGANACQLIDYVCPVNTAAFNNGCGCGCEEAQDCPQWVDCEPGNTSCALMRMRCPYSEPAF